MNKQAMSEEMARKLLTEKLMERRKACWEEIGAVLKKYGFRIDTTTVLTSDGRVVHQHSLEVIPADQGQAPPRKKSNNG